MKKESLHLIFVALISFIVIAVVYSIIEGMVYVVTLRGIYEEATVRFIWGLGIVTGMFIMILASALYNLKLYLATNHPIDEGED